MQLRSLISLFCVDLRWAWLNQVRFLAGAGSSPDGRGMKQHKLSLISLLLLPSKEQAVMNSSATRIWILPTTGGNTEVDPFLFKLQMRTQSSQHLDSSLAGPRAGNVCILHAWTNGTIGNLKGIVSSHYFVVIHYMAELTGKAGLPIVFKRLFFTIKLPSTITLISSF